VTLVQTSTQHRISPEEQILIKNMCKRVQQWMVALYSEHIITPNSHWILHIPLFIQWYSFSFLLPKNKQLIEINPLRYSVPRGYWTFPQESILALAKKSTRKMTNHRAVSYSCVRLFVLERALGQFLAPNLYIPDRFKIEGGEVCLPGNFAELMGIPESQPVVKNPRIVWDDQIFFSNLLYRTQRHPGPRLHPLRVFSLLFSFSLCCWISFA